MTVRDALETAIYTKLCAGTALIADLGGSAIYNLQAPNNASLPYVIYSHVSGGPENICSSDMRDQLYLVRAFARTQAKVRSIENNFDVLLHGGSLSVTGYTNYRTVRDYDAPSTVENLANGEKVYGSGGYYRIKLDA